MKPMRLSPVYMTSVWAGDRLKHIRGLCGDKIGIAREVCTYQGSENMVEEGVGQGCRLDEVIAEYRDDIMGADDGNQLIRLAYMDTAEDLSIQVHPNQQQAEEMGDFEKSESWYILEADEDARITAGVTTDNIDLLTEEALKQNLEPYLIRIPVKKGDFAMIPAGMIHACGKGMLALEIGSFGGLTFRLYDYGRGRPLHLERGLRIVNPNLTCEILHMQEIQYGVIRPLVHHELFSVDLVDVKDEWQYKKENSYVIVTCVEGSCECMAESTAYSMEYTQTLLIPARCASFVIRGNARILLSRRRG